MRTPFLLFLFLCIFGNTHAQTTQHQVFSTAGDQFSTPFMQQSWTLGEGVTEYLQNPSLGMSQGFQQSDLYRDLQGLIRYDNGFNTLLSFTPVFLKQGGTTLQQTNGNAYGSYRFANLPNGMYQLKASPQKPWGGGNATDALMIMKHFTNVFQLQGLRRTAADVDGSGYINSVDALQVMKRFVSLQNSFQIGDWVSETPAVIINGFQHQQQNLKALCAGDVDGSLIPGAKSGELYALTFNSIAEAQPGDSLTIPIRITELTRLSALSLVLRYKPDWLEICAVSMNRPGAMVYNLTDDVLRLAWYTTEAVQFEDEETLLFIRLRIKKDIPVPDQDNTFALDGETLLSDFAGNTIENRTLQIPLITTRHQGFYLGQNEPNPLMHTCQIPCFFPEAGSIRLSITDPAGNQAAPAMESPVSAGELRFSFRNPGLAPGVYFYTLQFTCKSGIFRQSRRMIVIQ